jgi:hypothetical protein
MWKNVTYRNYFLAAIIVDLVTALLIFILKNNLPPLVPLLYGRPAGEAELTVTAGLFIAPGVGFIITFLNLFISLWVKDNFLKKILAISSIVISALMAITIVKIVFLVGFF